MRLTFCVACGETNTDLLEHHHLLPRAEGGLDEDTNLITLCLTCHGRVHGVIRRPSVELRRIREKASKANAALHPDGRPLALPPRRRLRTRKTTKREQMRERARAMRPLIEEMKAQGMTGVAAIARGLNMHGLRRPNGGDWCCSTVSKLLRQIERDFPYTPTPERPAAKHLGREAPFSADL